MAYKKVKSMIFTEDPDSLILFYRDCLGFKETAHLTFPKDNGYNLEIAPGYELWLAKHSEVHGANKDPYRTILNIYVDSVTEIYNRVIHFDKVQSVQEPVCMNEFVPGEKRWVATIFDPEGNCVQFMGGE